MPASAVSSVQCRTGTPGRKKNTRIGKHTTLKAFDMTPTDFEINGIIDQAIESLADDDIRQGGESLTELAILWSKAGMPIQSFYDIRKYIIGEAISRTDAVFITEKLKIAERAAHEQRNRTEKSKAWTKASSRL